MANTYSSNVSLPSPVGVTQDYINLINLGDAFRDAMTRIDGLLAGSQTAVAAGINGPVLDTGGKRLVNVQLLSAGSIATIIGAINGFPFTLYCQSAGSLGIPDAGLFQIAGAWIPTTQDTIMLVWDGTNYIELGRSTN